MPTYITLINYTPKGLENIKQSPQRLEKAQEVIKSKGGEMKSFHLTMGHYDAVAVSEAPNDEAYAEAILAIASAGAIRTETLKAFSNKEYRKIVGSLP